MVQVKILKNINGYKVGQIITITNNDAHTLIEQGLATTNIRYKNKMMRSE